MAAIDLGLECEHAGLWSDWTMSRTRYRFFLTLYAIKGIKGNIGQKKREMKYRERLLGRFERQHPEIIQQYI